MNKFIPRFIIVSSLTLTCCVTASISYAKNHIKYAKSHSYYYKNYKNEKYEEKRSPGSHFILSFNSTKKT